MSYQIGSDNFKEKSSNFEFTALGILKLQAFTVSKGQKSHPTTPSPIPVLPLLFPPPGLNRVNIKLIILIKLTTFEEIKLSENKIV